MPKLNDKSPAESEFIRPQGGHLPLKEMGHQAIQSHMSFQSFFGGSSFPTLRLDAQSAVA